MLDGILKHKAVKAKAKAKAKATDTATTLPTVKSTTLPTVKATTLQKPSVAHEASRGQYLARTGGRGPGASKAFKYGDGSMTKEAAQAKAAQ